MEVMNTRIIENFKAFESCNSWEQKVHFAHYTAVQESWFPFHPQFPW